MQNKRIFLLSLIIPIAFLSVVFSPRVSAAYNPNSSCSVSYPGTDSVSPFTYDNCCYPSSAEPYQGIYCRPDNSVVRKVGSNPPICSTYQEVLNLASSARSANLSGFNCFDGTPDSTCRANYCKNSSNTCVAISGVSCPAGLNRQQICPGGCGACGENFVYCVANIPTPIPNELTNPTLACIAKKDGSTYGPNGGKTCAQLGRDVANACTGACTDCPVGTTPSGREVGVCKTYGERFLEILADGLAILGGPSGDGRYDYSVTGPAAIKNIYVKSDNSESLNWNSSTLPAEIKWLLRNYNLCTTNADCVSPRMCSESGFCYKPGAISGSSCTNDSDCDLGQICNASGVCVASPPSPESNVTPKFVGLTPASYKGNQTNYPTANNLCKNGTGALSGSHICYPEEMIYSINNNAAALSGVTGSAWVNAGHPGYIKFPANDCSGWTDGTSTDIFGTIWNFTSKFFKVSTCDRSLPIACCK
jgi:hypothetical protein